MVFFSDGRQWTAMEGNDRHWTAMDGNGRPLTAMDGIGRQWTALDGNGRPWTAMDGNGRQWKAMGGNTCHRTFVRVEQSHEPKQNKRRAPVTEPSCEWHRATNPNNTKEGHLSRNFRASGTEPRTKTKQRKGTCHGTFVRAAQSHEPKQNKRRAPVTELSCERDRATNGIVTSIVIVVVISNRKWRG